MQILKTKDNSFSCITPSSWKPSEDIVTKKILEKIYQFGKNLILKFIVYEDTFFRG